MSSRDEQVTRALIVLTLVGSLTSVRGADLGGVAVALDAYEGPASVAAEVVGPFKLQLTVNPGTENRALAIRVSLPSSGPRAWPTADVEVRDAEGKAMMVRHVGIEWGKLIIPVPAVAAKYFVQAPGPREGKPKPPTEKERVLVDGPTGLRLGIAKWYDGRTAALSIRFDDSHPTHLTKAVPILREYGFRGTFMVNPGPPEPGSRKRYDFVDHRAEWEAVARDGHHELANHSAHHRGVTGDDAMEAEIGDAARAIWALTPGKSKLMALNLGGGTQWETTRTLRYYLDKYHQFDASGNSTGMDDSYGNRVENFRRMLEQHIERGLWLRIHYHYIGEGLSSSEANFRAAMEIAKAHQPDLWIAGMADIHKYETERNAARLTPVRSDATQLEFQIACQTNPELYDQPLTLELTRSNPADENRATIKDAKGQVIPARRGEADGGAVLRFDVAPRDGKYSIEIKP
ncbi:MAG TPA: polysaccharide deacetylase family protein [Verrucomicrobiae bacterium]|nr:polysaccharide deacetylase family protein [Verrucomicrobiae bacterium]